MCHRIPEIIPKIQQFFFFFFSGLTDSLFDTKSIQPSNRMNPNKPPNSHRSFLEISQTFLKFSEEFIFSFILNVVSKKKP